MAAVYLVPEAAYGPVDSVCLYGLTRVQADVYHGTYENSFRPCIYSKHNTNNVICQGAQFLFAYNKTAEYQV